MNNQPLVSVIVTVYNVEKYIERCIRSVLAQSFQSFELVIVDDRTPDNSMDIAEKYAKTDERIRLVYLEENTGLMWARKEGVEHSSGKYIVFLDSDDALPHNTLELLYNTAVSEQADAVSGNAVYKKTDGTEELWRLSLPYGNSAEGIYKAILTIKYRFNLWGRIYARSLLTENDYLYFKNFTLSEDHCLFYQVVEKTKKLVHIDALVYFYFQREDSSSQGKMNERSMETTVIAHRVSYDIISKYPSLEPFMYRNYQYYFCRRMLEGNYGLIPYLKEYDLYDVISNKNIFRYYKKRRALELILMKSRLFGFFFRKIFKIH